MVTPTELVYLFAAADQPFYAALSRHVSTLDRERVIAGWHPRMISPGEPIAGQLQAALARADLLLALVSADLLACEDCQSILLKARERGLRIIPILVRPAFWESSFIGSEPALPRGGVAISTWPDQDQGWLAVVSGLLEYLGDLRRAPASNPDSSRRPSAPNWPGEHYDPIWYVHRKWAEQEAETYLDIPGKPVILWGPELFGKTWLLEYMLDKKRRQDRPWRIARVNLSSIVGAGRASYEDFLFEVALTISEELEDGDGWVAGWQADRVRNGKRKLTRQLKTLLAKEPRPLIVAIDRADAIMDSGFREDFFALLRSWADDRDAPWPDLRLLLSVSTTPARLTQHTYNSPFSGLSEPIELDSLDRGQIEQLALRYGVSHTSEDLNQMERYLGGHPYLVRLAMSICAQRKTPLAELLKANYEARPFERHLRHCRSYLDSREGLWAALRQVGRTGSQQVDAEAFEHLRRLGLVRQGKDGVYRLGAELYGRLLENR